MEKDELEQFYQGINYASGNVKTPEDRWMYTYGLFYRTHTLIKQMNARLSKLEELLINPTLSAQTPPQSIPPEDAGQ